MAEPPELPDRARDRAERLTRRALAAADSEAAAAYRSDRDDLLAEHGYHAREREAGETTVLVCYPDAWVADGAVQPERIDDVDAAVEVPIGGGDHPTDWAAVADHNDAIAEAVARAAGPPHDETARALATYASNHYGKRIEALTSSELERFRDEFLPRNAWPSDAQLDAADATIRRVYEETDVACPI